MKKRSDECLIYIRINEAIIGECMIEDVNLDIDANSIVGVIGSGSHDFIGIMLGNTSFDGDIVLDYVSLKGDIQDYKEMISVTNKLENINETTLSVQEYIDFCSLYFNSQKTTGSEELKNELIQDFGLDKNIQVKQLSESELIKLNVLVGFLKQSKVLIMDDFFEDCKTDDKMAIANYIKKYANKRNVILLISEDQILIKQVCEAMIMMPENKLYEI